MTLLTPRRLCGLDALPSLSSVPWGQLSLLGLGCSGAVRTPRERPGSEKVVGHAPLHTTPRRLPGQTFTQKAPPDQPSRATVAGRR